MEDLSLAEKDRYYHVVEFVVSVDDTCTVGRQVFYEPVKELIEMWHRSDFLSCFDILGRSLRFRNGFECLHLAAVVSSGSTKLFQTDTFIWNRMELSKCLCRSFPPTFNPEFEKGVHL